MQLRSRSSLKRQRFTKKEIVIKSKAKFTRTRVMKRRLISKIVTVSKKKTLVSVPKASISPIMSEFSTDDDTPLNQITQKKTEAKKKSPGPEKPASASPTTSQVKRKRSKPLDEDAKKLCTLRSAAAAAAASTATGNALNIILLNYKNFNYYNFVELLYFLVFTVKEKIVKSL